MKGYHKGIRAQILEAMAAGVEMKTAEIVAHVDGTRQRVSLRHRFLGILCVLWGRGLLFP